MSSAHNRRMILGNSMVNETAFSVELLYDMISIRSCTPKLNATDIINVSIKTTETLPA